MTDLFSNDHYDLVLYKKRNDYEFLSECYNNCDEKYHNIIMNYMLMQKHEMYDWICKNKFKGLEKIIKRIGVNSFLKNIFDKKNNKIIKDIYSLDIVKNDFKNIMTNIKKTGFDEESYGNLKWIQNSNFTEIVDNIQPIINYGEDCMGYFVDYLTKILEQNIEYTQSNSPLDYCSSQQFLQKILVIIIELYCTLSEKLIYNKHFPRTNNSKLIQTDIKDNLDTKILILMCNSLKICYIPLFEQLTLTPSKKKFIKFINDKMTFVIKKIIDTKIYITDEIFICINKKMSYDKIILKKKSVIDIDFCFDVLNKTKNPQALYLSVDNILSCEEKIPSEKLIPLCKYLIDVDIFKNLSMTNAHKHFNNVLNLICGMSSNIDIKDKSNIIFMKCIHKICSKITDYVEELSSYTTLITKKCNEFKEKKESIIKEQKEKIDGKLTLEIIEQNYNRIVTEYYKYEKKSNIIFVKILVNSILSCFEKLNILINNLIGDINNLEYELISPLINVITENINYLNNGANPIIEVFEQNYEASKILKNSFELMNKVKNNKYFIKEIKNYKKDMEMMLPRVKLQQNIFDDLKIYFEDYKIEEDDEDDVDIPEEFIDKLTCVLIENPIMIPNVDLVFDKSSILSQLYTNEINPYTREKLSIEDLEKFNKEEDIIKKIAEFNEKITLYKNQKKRKHML